MLFFKKIFRRAQNSAVAWSWVLNGTRLASGILLLPLLLHKLSAEDLGMFYIFGYIAAIVPIVDFGFSGSVGRAVSYAMGGAHDIKEQGMQTSTTSEPNYALVWQLLFTTRRLYRWMSVLAFFLIGTFGTFWVGMRIHETSHPGGAWIAWGVTLISAILEIYFGWWNSFLMGLNEVVFSSRLAALMNTLKIALAAALLLFGFGLMALPIAGFASSFLTRHLARRHCLALLEPHPAERTETTSLLKKLWPNSWRTGISILSSYLRNNAAAFICTQAFGLAMTGTLGLSLQIINLIQNLSQVWVYVKWPSIGQHLVRQEYSIVRKVLWPRFWLQCLTFVLLSAILVPAAPVCVRWMSALKQHSSTFSADDIKDLAPLTTKLGEHRDSISEFLWENFSDSTRQMVLSPPQNALESQALKETLASELNTIIQRKQIYDPKRFENVTILEDTRALLKKGAKGISVPLNKMLLEDSYPLEIFSHRKHVLPLAWFAILVVNAALDLQFAFWTTLFAMENRLPFLWPSVITNACSPLLALLLLRTTSMGVLALIIAPLAISSLFNYWYWPLKGAANLKTTLWQFCFIRPETQSQNTHTPCQNHDHKEHI